MDNPHEAGEWARVAATTAAAAAAAASAGGSFAIVPVFSDNVHEARGYNRAAAAARGAVLVVWQVGGLGVAGGGRTVKPTAPAGGVAGGAGVMLVGRCGTLFYYFIYSILLFLFWWCGRWGQVLVVWQVGGLGARGQAWTWRRDA